MGSTAVGPSFGPTLQHTWLDTMEVPEVVTNFLDKDYYFDHYEGLAAYAEQLINDALKVEDMQPYKTTSRAKTVESLREKLTVRYEERKAKNKEYKNSDDIKEDIVDLAGVRIILYMPTEKEHKLVEKVVQSIWGKDVKPKLHPEPKKSDELEANGSNESVVHKKKYQPRHLGYRAIHYRCNMKQHQGNSYPHLKYHWKPEDKVEIQVVSALTHAWSMVGHDITYKSYAYGQPTVQEERALDALNGLVQSGELLLEQFHEMVNKRTYARWKHRDELETYLREVDVLQEQHSESFRSDGLDADGLDVLLGFLTRQNNNYPIALRTALKGLGFPYKPRLDNVMAQFSPEVTAVDGMRAVICLIHSMLPRPYTPTLGTDLPSRKQCIIMMSALNFLQRVFGQAEDANDYLRALKMTDDERKSLDFVLRSDKRQVFLQEKKDQERDKPSLRDGWLWFQRQARNPKSICGLAFQLAEMGSMKDVNVYSLLEGLTIGQFGSLSRSSTTSMDDDGDSSKE